MHVIAFSSLMAEPERNKQLLEKLYGWKKEASNLFLASNNNSLSSHGIMCPMAHLPIPSKADRRKKPRTSPSREAEAWGCGSKSVSAFNNNNAPGMLSVALSSEGCLRNKSIAVWILACKHASYNLTSDWIVEIMVSPPKTWIMMVQAKVEL